MSLRMASGMVDSNIIFVLFDAYMHGSRFSQSNSGVLTPLHWQRQSLCDTSDPHSSGHSRAKGLPSFAHVWLRQSMR